jgi:hypothetical protein
VAKAKVAASASETSGGRRPATTPAISDAQVLAPVVADQASRR